MVLATKRFMEAEMWLSNLVSSLANVMPDVNRKELPACMTMGKVYAMYIEATQSGPIKPLQRTVLANVEESFSRSNNS